MIPPDFQACAGGKIGLQYPKRDFAIEVARVGRILWDKPHPIEADAAVPIPYPGDLFYSQTAAHFQLRVRLFREVCLMGIRKV